MRIVIAQRYRPFTQRPGARFLVPGTRCTVQVFPTLLRWWDEAGVLSEHDLGVNGPATDFTAQLDLENGCVRVWGHFEEGFIRYAIHGCELRVEKGLIEAHLFPGTAQPVGEVKERLALGMHKKQDWEGIERRRDCRELFPLLLHLAQQLPIEAAGDWRAHSLEDFVRLWCGHLRSLMYPVLVDDLHQGIEIAGLPSEDALSLIRLAAREARRCFVRESADGFALLPALPPEFHAGRYTGLQLGNWGSLDMEWTKKRIRRVRLSPTKDGELPLSFGRDVRSFRLRHNSKEKGGRLAVDEPLRCRAGQVLLLDNFQQ